MQVGLRPRLRARSSLLDLVRARNEAERKSKEASPSPLSSPSLSSPSLSSSGTSSPTGLFLGGPPTAVTGAASTEAANHTSADHRKGASPAATSSAPPQHPRLASAAALAVPLPNSPPSSPYPPPTPPAPSSSRVPPTSSSAAPTDPPAAEPDAAHVPASSRMASVRPPLSSALWTSDLLRCRHNIELPAPQHRHETNLCDF